jgi:hypothetical protein
VVQNLTEDHNSEKSTGCACRRICSGPCACYRAHGTCERSCSCKGGRGCELRIRVIKNLFGSYQGIKLTSCFEKEISTYANAHWDLSQNPEGLSMMSPANRMDPLFNPNDYFKISHPCPATEEDFVRNVDELVESLRSKALAVRNGIVPQFPFKLISETRGCTALVSWYNKWQSAPLNEQLTQELLRYALTDDPSHDCYYSFCSDQWESKSTTRHCEACDKCVKSQLTHCAICHTCFLGNLAWHQSSSDCHVPGA